jgi:hypothetical protein
LLILATGKDDIVVLQFPEHEITYEALLHMKEDFLASIIPKAGPRALNLHAIQEVT